MSTLAEQVRKAVAAHGMWKARLRTAIDNGTLDIEPAKVRADNQCEFGKWLYGTEISAPDKASGHYAKVKQLHAEFHAAAGKIASAAIAGGKADAEKLLGGEFAGVSGRLTMEMMQWSEAAG